MHITRRQERQVTDELRYTPVFLEGAADAVLVAHPARPHPVNRIVVAANAQPGGRDVFAAVAEHMASVPWLHAAYAPGRMVNNSPCTGLWVDALEEPASGGVVSCAGRVRRAA